MERLLDSSLSNEEFVTLLERVIQAMYTFPNADERNEAQRVLTKLQEIPESWLRVDKVLDNPNSSETAKFYALQILGDMIRYRWKLLPRESRDQIKDYVVRKVIELSSDEETMRREEAYLAKLNWSLVQVVKQEWPGNWRSFMTDIVGASKTSTSRCENNLQILALLSEEVFQFSAGQMTQEKVDNLKTQFNNEFSKVFELCQFVFQQSPSLSATRPELLIATLTTLEKFLAWIPLGYIFETKLIETLLECLAISRLRNYALKCLVEIGSLSVGNVYDQRFRFLYVSFMQHLMTVVPVSVDIASAYENADDDTQTFIMDLALFFSGFFKHNLRVVESADDEAKKALQVGLEYLVRISMVSDVEVFKTCLEFWHQFAGDLHVHQQRSIVHSSSIFHPLPMDASRDGERASFESRMALHERILSMLRTVMISRVPKPEEVLIVEDDNGEIVRETIKDTDAIAMYKTVRETLVYLCHLGTADTENIMLEKLAQQLWKSEWSWNKLNTLCWAIGSISGAMSEDEEKKFLVTVVRELLQLCELKQGKDNKAVVASNIMYVVGQYPRFLRAHWKFLKTVVNKLFEFMHEKHPGVQDMACDTFLKIAQKCRRKFVRTQVSESRPFINEILNNLVHIIKELEPHQIHSFYESCGWVIAVSPPEEQSKLVKQLFELPNLTWQHIMDEARVNEQELQRRENMKSLVTILRTNTRVAGSLGSSYVVQLRGLFPDMMKVYAAYSRMLTDLVRMGGPQMTKSVDARNIRAVKKEIAKVLQAFLGTNLQNPEEVMASVIQPLIEPMLGDYYESAPELRDAEVLSLFSQIVTFTSGLPVPMVRLVFKSLFECTLEMIKNNFEDYPDTRLNFFMLLRTINRYNFPALFSLNDDPAVAEADFKVVINAILWAIKHTERNVAETGLTILLELLGNVDKSTFVGYFYRTCFRLVLNDILSVLTDTLHRPGFKHHAMVLAHMLSVIAGEALLSEPIWIVSNQEEVAMAGNPPSNQVFVKNHLETLLRNAFPNLTPRQVERVVANMFGSLSDEHAFKGHLRDFLIQTKEFSSGDNTDLYDEEKQAELAEQRKREAERLARTPGLAPVPLPDEGMDD